MCDWHDKVFENIRQGQIEVARLDELLLKRDEDGRSLLHAACSRSDVEVIKCLLDLTNAKKVINNKDDEGWTPLQSACSIGNNEIVKALLEAGADVDSTNNGGRSALHYAASKGHLLVITSLIDAGCKIMVKDKTGSTPLHRACSAGKILVVEKLLDLPKVNLDIRDSHGCSPIHVAVESGHKDIILLLMEKGADVTLKDKDNVSALDLIERDKNLAKIIREQFRDFAQHT